MSVLYMRKLILDKGGRSGCRSESSGLHLLSAGTINTTLTAHYLHTYLTTWQAMRGKSFLGPAVLIMQSRETPTAPKVATAVRRYRYRLPRIDSQELQASSARTWRWPSRGGALCDSLGRRCHSSTMRDRDGEALGAPGLDAAAPAGESKLKSLLVAVSKVPAAQSRATWTAES